MSKKPYEDLIEQKVRQEMLKGPGQHRPSLQTRTTEEARKTSNRRILETLKAKEEERMLKTISTRCKEYDRGVPCVDKILQIRQGRCSSQDRMLTILILNTEKIVMARIRQGR